MRVSVWCPELGLYDYFETPEAPDLPRGATRRLVALDDALPEIPSGARRVGRGADARGTIVTERRDHDQRRASPWLLFSFLVGGYWLSTQMGKVLS